MKIELKGISKKYGKTSVLSNVNQNFIEGVYGGRMAQEKQHY